MPIRSFVKRHVPFHLHGYGEFHVDEDTALYITHTTRTIAVNLIGIFLPIYIYTISEFFPYFHDDRVLNGLIWVLAYFFLRSLGVVITMTTLGNAIFSKIHFQRAILISFILLIIEILLWFLARQHMYLILVAGAIAGLKVALYWIPYHIFFIRKIKTVAGHYGKKTGYRFFLVRIASGITPFLGGLIISSFGFNVLFMFSILLLLVAGIPISFNVTEGEHRKEHDIKKIFKDFYFNKKFKLLTLGYFGDGADAVIYAIFWPILLFLVLDNFVKVGFINSVSLILSSVTVLWVGKLLDKHGSKVVHGIGVLINSLLYIPRMLFTSPGLFYAIDVLDRLNSAFYSLPNMSLSYEKAKRTSDSNFTLYRELAIHIAIVLVTFVTITLITMLNTWRWVFVISMIGSLMTYFLDLDKN